jgi:hypothetical protein
LEDGARQDVWNFPNGAWCCAITEDSQVCGKQATSGFNLLGVPPFVVPMCAECEAKRLRHRVECLERREERQWAREDEARERAKRPWWQRLLS